MLTSLLSSLVRLLMVIPRPVLVMHLLVLHQDEDQLVAVVVVEAAAKE
jgi:hypothetical protein